MSNYTKATNFTAKDSLPSGDTNKVVRGSEFDTEFNAISTAIATKAESVSPTFTGTTTLATATATTLGTTTFEIGGVAVTATAAELNTLDGVTASTSELNLLDGVTASTSELNLLDGVTASTSELNLLDGVTASTSELNLVDGVTSTTDELNIVDGDKAAVSTTLADADRVVVNDDGTMKQVALTDVKTYLESGLTNLSAVTGVSALTSGSIGSGFGAIDVGSNAITSTGTVTFGSLSDGAVTITAFADEDTMTSDSATAIPTQQSVKAYVDSNAGISSVLSDNSPQLGGNLDVNGNSIVSASAGNISITPDGAGKVILDGLSWPTADGTADHVIKTDGSGNLSFTAQSGGGGGGASVSVSETAPGSPSSGDLWYDPNSAETFVYYNDGDSNQWVQTNPAAHGSSAGGISDIVSDTTPQLGGNLDVNGQDIVSVTNGDIEIDPHGTGVVAFKGNATKGSGQFKLNCENNSHGITLKGPPHSAAANYTLTLPNDDGTADQVLSTNGSGVLSWAAGASGAGVTVYADIDALPLSGITEGSMALVDSTDRLYIWSDTGWYNIALVNTTPTISGVNAAYDLATNGTATVITITATDPEGIPITYSLDSDTSGTAATVTQGTGANTHVWTITPSTNSTHAGSFSLTFKASDGVNIATAASTFTLEFTIAESAETVMLLNAVGSNGAVNSTFVDGSSTGRTITMTETPSSNPPSYAKQVSYSPYSPKGWSLRGSTAAGNAGDPYKSLAFAETAADEFTMGTGNFTVECWVFWDNTLPAGALEHTFVTTCDPTDQQGFWLGATNNNFQFSVSEGSGWSAVINPSLSSGNASYVTTNKWFHVVGQRNGTSFRLYVNGVSVASATGSYNLPNSNNAINITNRRNYNQFMPGLVHDVRVVKGSAIYVDGSNADLTSFTPPTAALTAVSGTVLLTARKPYIIDEIAGLTYTLYGQVAASRSNTVSPTAFSPFDVEEYNKTIHGGSFFADGGFSSGNTPSGHIALSVPDDDSLEPGSSDFTLEFWARPVNQSASGWTFYYIKNDGRFGVYVLGDQLHLGLGVSSNWSDSWATGYYMVQDIWQHICFTRSGSTLTLYVNGISQGTDTFSGTIGDLGSTAWIGGGYSSSQNINGYMADFRLSIGTVERASAFTPPTSPISQTTNTKLLLQFQNAGLTDQAQTTEGLGLIGNVQASSTQTKYRSTSLKFDGTGDYLEVSVTSERFTFDTGGFTVEMWVYLNNNNTAQTFIDFRDATNNADAGVLHLPNSGYVKWEVNSSALITSSAELTASAWHHLAICKDSAGTMRMFFDGTETGSSYSDTKTYATKSEKAYVGATFTPANYLNGYLSDIRVTRNARYTSNFTAPAAALKA